MLGEIENSRLTREHSSKLRERQCLKDKTKLSTRSIQLGKYRIGNWTVLIIIYTCVPTSTLLLYVWPNCDPRCREAVRDARFCPRSLVHPSKPPFRSKLTRAIFYKPETHHFMVILLINFIISFLVWEEHCERSTPEKNAHWVTIFKSEKDHPNWRILQMS